MSDAIPHLDAISDLDTPSLLIDLDTLEDNITEMQEAVRASGVALRPHAKTHKCPDIARMQLEAGARGITVAKLGEAEVMVDAGIDDVLIAYPIVGEQKLSRLRELAARAQIAVTTDSVEVAEGLGRVGKDLGREMPVLVEVDTGLHRLGRPPGASTVALVQELSELPGVEIVGLLTHAGHAYRSSSREELQAVAEREGRDLVETAERCAEVGIPLRRISVGSTPTARIVAGVPGVTEIRPGTYVFNDVQQMRLGVATEERCALGVLTTVVAHPSDERFVLDAGTKAFTSDGADGPPFPGRGVVAGRPELRLDFMNEEHAVGRRTGRDDVRIGERLEVIPLHACATVNMFDRAFGVRDGEVVRTFDIAARGKLR
ncbi:MAG TPA: alanine racemase [Actinomycetota bacterium]|nr:alanine racemase [Actinomycetota bacterium]